MLGENYGSLGEFINACRTERVELDTARGLGKIYNVNELRELASEADITLPQVTGAGRERRYSTADAIAECMTAASVGEFLSDYDHKLRFPIVTYYQIPEHKSYSSYNNFLRTLREKDIPLNNGFKRLYNGITEPPPHNCKLESVKSNNADRIISLLFSCTRALVNPMETMSEYTNLFLARVPVLIRVCFNLGLVEFSVPTFSEPIAGSFNYEVQAPKRYQQAFQSAYKTLRTLTDCPLTPLRYSELPAWFEQEYDAKDMGWKIAPRDDADFDLTQNLIPLKDIIDGFMRTLERQCTAMGRSHKLEGVDLYHVFRSLQNESHTHTMVQSVPFGQRGGELILSIYYGIKGASYYPVILLSNPPTEPKLDNLRDAVSKLREATIDDRYAINTLLVDDN